MVADKPQLEQKLRFLGVTQRRRHAGIGHRDDDIGIHLVLPGQLPAQFLADHIDVLAEDIGVGARKIDEFEDARRRLHLF